MRTSVHAQIQYTPIRNEWQPKSTGIRVILVTIQNVKPCNSSQLCRVCGTMEFPVYRQMIFSHFPNYSPKPVTLRLHQNSTFRFVVRLLSFGFVLMQFHRWYASPFCSVPNFACTIVSCRWSIQTKCILNCSPVFDKVIDWVLFQIPFSFSWCQSKFCEVMCF